MSDDTSDDICGWIEHWAQQDPRRTAIHFDGHDIGYGELRERIGQLAARLADGGAAPGDRIAYLGANHPEMLALVFACARTGTILVPLNWRLSATELSAVLRDCVPIMLLCDSEFAETGATIASASGTPLAPLRAGSGVWLDCAWPEALRRGASDPHANASEGLVLLMYTSGTTGLPKGAAHTRSGTDWNALNAIDGYGLTADDNVLANLPLFHVGGLTMLTLPALKVGAQITLHRRFDAALALRDIAARRVTMMLAVATTLKALFDHPLWPACDTASLRLVMTGASIIPHELLQPFFDRGVIASQVFGATEMGIGACLPPGEARRRLGSVGRAALHRAMKLVAADGSTVAQGEVGEFVFGGPGLMLRYWRDPAGTAACLQDGWFRTGDLGTCDADGYCKIVSRKKEMIISGGENIYPAEIENVLASCPGVAEVAVVGRADERWGEVPVAFVVRMPGSEVSADALASVLQANLSRYKQPRGIAFIESLPRNAMGKVLRADLRRRADAERVHPVDRTNLEEKPS